MIRSMRKTWRNASKADAFEAQVPSLDGRCFAYVFPCVWEDHCKIGYSHDPLSRIAALHRRWFEFFDLDRAVLVEAETERDARDLELELRRPLSAHRAPAPMAVRVQAGGQTEWVRGAAAALEQAVDALARRGHRVHAPAADWLRAALQERSERLYEWTWARLSSDELDGLVAMTPGARVVRDSLDACAALGIDLEAQLPPAVLHWYRRG